jgi:glycosyltransferase involved in cell wall biosynthesis
VHGAVFEGLGVAVVAGRLSRARVVIEETSFATNRSPRGHALYRSLVAASDACVAISPAVRDYLRDVTGVPEAKITLVPNGAIAPTLPTPELAASIRASLGIGAGAFVVGTVARLTDDNVKRVSDLVRATAQLRDVCPELRLLVVGGGADQAMLAELAKSLRVDERVILTGHREDIGNLYAVMQVFALVSAREGFGLAVAEAMLCNLAVIGSNIGGIKDLVEPDKTGILVPAHDPSAIAEAILRLRGDDVLRSSFGNAGRLRAELYFSAQRYADDVDAFYTKLLKSPSLWPHRD